MGKRREEEVQISSEVEVNRLANQDGRETRLRLIKATRLRSDSATH